MALVQYDNEYKRLRKIALYRPLPNEIEQSDAEKAMYISIPDSQKVLSEFDEIVQKFIELGVEAIVLESDSNQPLTSNMIYLRDVAFPFRDKIFLANMKHGLRQLEPAKFKLLLSSIDPSFNDTFVSLPIATTMEGADLLVLNDDLVYAYVGSRTSQSISSVIDRYFPETDVRNIEANIHGVPQHILGGVHILDEGLASRRTQYCTDELEGHRYIDFDETDEIRKGFALNIVTIGPSEILMPAHSPDIKRRLEAEGITCHEVEVSEIHKMGGGLACMVLPLYRD